MINFLAALFANIAGKLSAKGFASAFGVSRAEAAVTPGAIRTNPPKAIVLPAGYAPPSVWADVARYIDKKYFDEWFVKYKLIPLVVAIVGAESSYGEYRWRDKPGVRDDSYGPMQVVPATAGADVVAFGKGSKVDNVPLRLATTEIGMKFGMAYLQILVNRYGVPARNEPLARAYNGGPSGATKTATLAYWRKINDNLQRGV